MRERPEVQTLLLVEDELRTPWVLGGEEQPSGAARRVLVSGVGELIVRKANAHPNFILLVERLLQGLAIAPAETEIRWDRDRELLGRLSDG